LAVLSPTMPHSYEAFMSAQGAPKGSMSRMPGQPGQNGPAPCCQRPAWPATEGSQLIPAHPSSSQAGDVREKALGKKSFIYFTFLTHTS
jgi:hypothetical protein